MRKFNAPVYDFPMQAKREVQRMRICLGQTLKRDIVEQNKSTGEMVVRAFVVLVLALFCVVVVARRHPTPLAKMTVS